MDTSVDPDGGTVVSPSAELSEKNREVVQVGPALTSLKGNAPGPEATCSLGITG